MVDPVARDAVDRAEQRRIIDRIRGNTVGEHRIKLHGERGSILWGYHEAATFRSWRIWRGPNGWQLSGRLARVDSYQARQRPLLFSAPRDKGLWAWGIETIEINGNEVRASLGEPEN